MAWIFQMWIETENNGDEIRNYFSSKEKLIINEKIFSIIAHQSGNTGSMITTDGISESGIHSKEDAIVMSKIGLAFYKLLKNAPDFRYALTGIEVDGWREFDELVEFPNDFNNLKGFVMNKEMYKQINSTVKMIDFKNEYLWIPYEGETYIERNAK